MNREKSSRGMRRARSTLALVAVAGVVLPVSSASAGMLYLDELRQYRYFAAVDYAEANSVKVTAAPDPDYIRISDVHQIDIPRDDKLAAEVATFCTNGHWTDGVYSIDCLRRRTGGAFGLNMDLGDKDDTLKVDTSVARTVADLGGGNDSFDATGSSTDTFVFGGDGDDTLIGSEGSDNFRGWSGRDRLLGNAGDDYLDGGAGVDTELAGGTGDDTLNYADATGNITVTIRSDLTALGSYRGDAEVADTMESDELAGVSGMENVLSGAGDDTLTLEHNLGGTLTGGGGTDTLTGGGGVDRLDGSGGDDTINAAGGADNVYGGAGADTIEARDGAVDFVSCGDEVDLPSLDLSDYSLGCEGALETRITEEPPSAGTDSTPTFKFASTLDGATFECRFDDQPYAACASPFTPTDPLSDGLHRFDVRAKAPDGTVDPTEESRSLSINGGNLGTPGEAYICPDGSITFDGYCPFPTPTATPTATATASPTVTATPTATATPSEPADQDGDGVRDTEDAFPTNPAESIDTDADGMGNNADADDDNDTVADVQDAFPLNAAESADTDRDGIGDNADTDDDNDGVGDMADAFPHNAAETADTDRDGTGDNSDADDDNDGVADARDAFPLDRNESVDTDNDGIGNQADSDDDGDEIADAADRFPLDPSESADADDDGIGNTVDTDDDNDGVADGQDAFPLNPAESVDTDNDGVGNQADTDDDGDGVADADDAFPLNAAEAVDTDGDGTGDNADDNDDNDGHQDAQDACRLQPGLAANGCPLPTDEQQCKRGGWTTYGATFRNQGGCVSYVVSRRSTS